MPKKNCLDCIAYCNIKEYDPETLMQELIDTVAEIYREKKEIKATALKLSLRPTKLKSC